MDPEQVKNAFNYEEIAADQVIQGPLLKDQIVHAYGYQNIITNI